MLYEVMVMKYDYSEDDKSDDHVVKLHGTRSCACAADVT